MFFFIKKIPLRIIVILLSASFVRNVAIIFIIGKLLIVLTRPKSTTQGVWSVGEAASSN